MTPLQSLRWFIYRAKVCPPLGRLVARLYHNRIWRAGCVINTHNPLITARVKAVIFWGWYERGEIQLIHHYMRRDLDVIELGGSLGVVTCQIRKRLEPSRKIVCVEADPRLTGEIRRNLRLNHLMGEVRVLNRAIDYSEPRRKFVPYAMGDSNLSGLTGQLAANQSTVMVEATTLSQLLKENDIAAYTLIADIEGAEAGIALCEAKALKGCQQVIMEFHPTTFAGESLSVEGMVHLFTQTHGFQIRVHDGYIYVFEKPS